MYLARGQGLELLYAFLRGGVGDAQLGDVVRASHANALAGGRQVQRVVLRKATLGTRRDDRILEKIKWKKMLGKLMKATSRLFLRKLIKPTT